MEEVIRPFGSEQTVSFVATDGARTTVTYDKLARIVATAGSRLRAQGVRAGDSVAVTITNDLEAVTAALGVWSAGATLVSLPPAPRRDQQAPYVERIGAVLTAMGCRHHLTSAAAVAIPGLQSLRIESLAGDDSVVDPIPPIPDIALVQFTSGSRGAPKGVAISREAFAGHIRMISGTLEMDPAVDCTATWLPLYHDLGFVCFFGAALYSRVPQVHTEPRAFVLNPARWLTMLAAEGATISGAPNFAFRLAARAAYPAGLDLSRMRLCLNAAERVLWPDLTAFQETAGAFNFPWQAISPAYGLAEGTVGASATVIGNGPRQGTNGHVSLGPPLPGSLLSVKEPTGPGPGSLLIDGDWLFAGYWTERGFEAQPARPFDTDDAGFIQDGEIYVIGRRGEVASVAGHNVFAEDIEALANTIGAPYVVGCAAFKHSREEAGESFGLVLEVSPRERPRAEELARRVRAAVADEAGIRPTPLVVVQSGVIPRTSSGKPRRPELRSMVLGDELPPRRIYGSVS
ncbi:AMP-binding protein [Natronosporangium hydrolyticum]|uniref:AMP-binding protein n=1 Tax=Natronosporangium hydrolyticum TaxID=2811111 RepID=A0A895YIP9_9ACTN|nr:AMP-binding protein [Natronosporangium hydrolyticum]QSB14000.1 AMP-binding protein [Natronosporangium hydrolyticum]